MREFAIVASTEIRKICPPVTTLPVRSVRAYATSPNQMGLQIRGVRGKTPHYAHAGLNREQVVALRDYLNTMLEEHLTADTADVA